METRSLQLENALPCIELTEPGIVMDVKPLQPLNASNLIAVTELGITVFLQPATNLLVAVSMIALQLLRLS